MPLSTTSTTAASAARAAKVQAEFQQRARRRAFAAAHEDVLLLGDLSA